MATTRSTIRDGLRELAARLPATPLTLVVAPAGSGKTTLLEAWRRSLAAGESTVASLDLARWHDDATSLASDLIDVLATTLVDEGRATRDLLASLVHPEREWPAILRSLLRALPGRGPSVVLFLDGAQELDPASPGAALLDGLVADAPPTLRLVLASRGPLPPSVARRALAAPPIEIGGADLSLRAQEIARLLTEHGVEPVEPLLTQLLARTEGWPTAVVIAARRLARTPPDERLRAVSTIGSGHELARYVEHEVLAGEPLESIAVLEAGAIVRDASFAELGALVASDDAKQVVEGAIRRGVLTESGDRLRVAAPWRLVLRQRLLARRDPGSLALRDRAVAQLVGRGAVDEACTVLADAGDERALAALLRRFGLTWIGMGRHASVVRWLEAVPPPQRENDPDLLRIEATARIASEPGRSEQLLLRARAVARREPGGRRSATVDGALIVLHAAQGRMQEASELARQAHSLRNLVRDPATRGAVALALAARALLARRFTRSLWLSERAARFPLTSPLRWLSSMNRAYLGLLAGRFDSACVVIDEALADPVLGRLPGSSAPLRAFRALASVLAADADGARRDAERAGADIAAAQFGLASSIVEIVLGQTYLLLGDAESARGRFEAALARASRAEHAPALGLARTGLAELALRDGDLVATRELARGADAAFRLASRGNGLVPSWSWAKALALLAAAGDPAAALERLREERLAARRTGLPWVDRHTAWLAASVARDAGDAAGAARFAAEGWQLTLSGDLPTHDPSIPSDLRWTAAEAIAAGLDASRVIARIRALDPHSVVSLLASLLQGRSRAVRLRAIAAIESDGDRRFAGALRELEHDRDARVRAAAQRARARLDPRPRHRVRIETLGTMRLLRDGDEVSEVEWRGVTTRRLLLRLLQAGERGISRDALIEDLWPDADVEHARNHLRVAISRLHDVLEPDRPDGVAPTFLVAEGDRLHLRSDVFEGWDLARFERLASTGLGRTDAGALARLQEALDACSGPLAPGMPDEPWLVPLRARVEDRFAKVAARLAATLIERGALEEAASVAARWIEIVPLDERGAALRMRALLALGDRGAALRCYEQMRDALERALGVSPGPALEALARAARGEPEPA